MKINLIGFRIDIKSCLVASAFKIKEKSSHQLIRPSQSDEIFRLLKDNPFPGIPFEEFLQGNIPEKEQNDPFRAIAFICMYPM